MNDFNALDMAQPTPRRVHVSDTKRPDPPYTIVEQEFLPAEKPAEQSTALTVVQRAEIALKMAERRTALAAMAQASTGITTITNGAGLQECHAARMRLKNERVGLEKLALATRQEANAFAKACIDTENTLIGIIEPEEKRLDAIEAAYNAEQDRIRQEVKNRERARQDAIQARIDELRDLGQEGRLKFKASEVQAFLDRAKSIVLNPANFDEHFERAVTTLDATRKILAETYTQLTAQEAERAEIKAQKEALAQQQREQAAKEKVNSARIAAIREKMDYSFLVRAAVGCSSGQIEKMLASFKLASQPLAATFEEFLPEAETAWTAAHDALAQMHNDAIERERAADEHEAARQRFVEEAERQRLAGIELARQQQEQRDRLAAEERTAQTQRMERDRLAQEERDKATRLANEEAIRIRERARAEEDKIEAAKAKSLAEQEQRDKKDLDELGIKASDLVAVHQACSKVVNLLAQRDTCDQAVMRARYRLGILEIVAELSTLAYPPPIAPEEEGNSIGIPVQSLRAPRESKRARKT